MLSKRNINILVTDDKPNMRRTIKNMLRQIGFKNIQEADDGDTAMQLLMMHRFDLVICDWNMPRMKGIEVLEKMKSDNILRSIPFLMVTAEIEEATVAKAAEMGSDSYIIKPFVPETLKKRIESLLEKRKNPDAIETRFQTGMKLLNAHQYDEAITVFQDILSINPHSPRTYYALGQVYEAKKDMLAAQKTYQKAVELSPKFVRAHERLAKIYEKTGDHQSALKHIEAAIKISPHNPHRQLEVGKLHLKMGKPKKAKEAFNSAIKLEPENAECLSEIGEAFLESGYSEEATKAFQTSLHIIPENIHVYNRLGIALRKQQKYKEAVAEYKKALEIDPENEYIMFNTGRAYQEWGRNKEAVKYYRKALELYESFPEAIAALKALGEQV